jgi:predicted DNA-binding protein (MmcQ/YjbR family)
VKSRLSRPDRQIRFLERQQFMNVDAIPRHCLSFPRATEKLQWGDDLCFKVCRLCFKCTPETFAELLERPDIRPAPYLGRYKWVMLDRLAALGERELQDLIRQSYQMVARRAGQSNAANRQKNRASTGSKGREPRAARKRQQARRSASPRS